MGHAAEFQRRFANAPAAVGRAWPRKLDLPDQPPQALNCRPAPWTPSSVQITSRSGGESDSMNQRAVSAP